MGVRLRVGKNKGKEEEVDIFMFMLELGHCVFGGGRVGQGFEGKVWEGGVGRTDCLKFKVSMVDL